MCIEQLVTSAYTYTYGSGENFLPFGRFALTLRERYGKTEVGKASWKLVAIPNRFVLLSRISRPGYMKKWCSDIPAKPARQQLFDRRARARKVLFNLRGRADTCGRLCHGVIAKSGLHDTATPMP
jgi:hypothetical protein